jgi:hypothetical protein
MGVRSHSTIEYPTAQSDTLTQSSLNQNYLLPKNQQYESHSHYEHPHNAIKINTNHPRSVANAHDPSLLSSNNSDVQSMRSSKSIIVTPEQLAERKKDILRRSNDRLKFLAE